MRKLIAYTNELTAMLLVQAKLLDKQRQRIEWLQTELERARIAEQEARIALLGQCRTYTIELED